MRKLISKLFPKKKSRTRRYGGQGTIHQTGHLDVEIWNGRIVAVWFRCQALPFRQANVDQRRANEMLGMYGTHHMPKLVGVEVADNYGCTVDGKLTKH